MRTGLTTEYKKQKLQRIQDELHSDQHFDRTETSYYGEFHPVQESASLINPCLCSAVAKLHHAAPESGSKKNRAVYFVRCSECDHQGPSNKADWQSIILWNKGRLSNHPHYQKLPLFGLRQLSPEAAKHRLVGIRKDLELRSKASGLRRDLGETHSNQKHLVKLKAYIAWCLYAQTLVKEAINQAAYQQRQLEKHLLEES